jgi:hypothetical protein
MIAGSRVDRPRVKRSQSKREQLLAQVVTAAAA